MTGPTTAARGHGIRTAIACCVAILALTAVAASAHTFASAGVLTCKSDQTEVWLGLGLGGGTAGTTYYPLEFSNISSRACSFDGYPRMWAYRGALRQLGPVARRNRRSHGRVVLAPGASAHALLGVVDWGVLCAASVTADALQVFPPGQRQAQEVPFSFPACLHQGVLNVGPLEPGVGIPGYTSP